MESSAAAEPASPSPGQRLARLVDHRAARPIALYGCFVLILLIGLLAFRDFGIGWDEVAQRELGMVTYNYLSNNDPAIHDFIDHQYGPAVELPLFAIEVAMGDHPDSRNVFFMRHLVGFLLFVVGCWFFYQLLLREFGWKWAMVGVVWLFASPRIFAESFINSKDIPFMAATIVAIYTLVQLLDRRTLRAALIHALATG